MLGCAKDRESRKQQPPGGSPLHRQNAQRQPNNIFIFKYLPMCDEELPAIESARIPERIAGAQSSPPPELPTLRMYVFISGIASELR